MFLPVGLAGLATKTKADAAIVFPDGTVHTAPLDGNYAVREAQKQVVQFNALAGATAPAATEVGSDPAVRLRKLQELRDAGLLTSEEYEAKRADIIKSIQLSRPPTVKPHVLASSSRSQVIGPMVSSAARLTRE